MLISKQNYTGFKHTTQLEMWLGCAHFEGLLQIVKCARHHWVSTLVAEARTGAFVWWNLVVLNTWLPAPNRVDTYFKSVILLCKTCLKIWISVVSTDWNGVCKGNGHTVVLQCNQNLDPCHMVQQTLSRHFAVIEVWGSVAPTIFQTFHIKILLHLTKETELGLGNRTFKELGPLRGFTVSL